MKIDSKDIINKQYILLDWNVIKYLKKPRDDADKDFLIILDRLRKRFEFPFCEAHLRDLAKSYSEENESFADKLSESQKALLSSSTSEQLSILES